MAAPLRFYKCRHLRHFIDFFCGLFNAGLNAAQAVSTGFNKATPELISYFGEYFDFPMLLIELAAV